MRLLPGSKKRTGGKLHVLKKKAYHCQVIKAPWGFFSLIQYDVFTLRQRGIFNSQSLLCSVSLKG